MKNLIIVPVFLFFFFNVMHISAQELNCSMQVFSPTIEGTDKSVFEAMQKACYEFVNNRKWTNYQYEINEKIECNILITVNERIGTDEFKANIQVQARRPVFNSSYSTTLLNIQDKDIQFKFNEFEPIEFYETQYTTNLASILAFYAYVIIGYDFDSFTPNGGTPYFTKCQTIINNSQGASGKGWKAAENYKNRYWLIENLLNGVYSPLREAMYKYHREGLDAMSDNLETGRAMVTEAIENLRKVHREKPNSYIMQMFFDAKNEELVNIYSQAAQQDKTRIINILNEIDPSNANKYRRILDGK